MYLLYIQICMLSKSDIVFAMSKPLSIQCRAASATKDAQGSLQGLEKELQKPANWQPQTSEGVWSKVKKTVTGAPPTPAEKTQQTAKDALAATQKAADEAIARAKRVG